MRGPLILVAILVAAALSTPVLAGQPTYELYDSVTLSSSPPVGCGC